MLNRKVCERCIDDMLCRKGSCGWEEMMEDELNWTRRGVVLCPAFHLRDKEERSVAKVGEPPPEWCPYVVEHAVSQKPKRC